MHLLPVYLSILAKELQGLAHCVALPGTHRPPCTLPAHLLCLQQDHPSPERLDSALLHSADAALLTPTAILAPRPPSRPPSRTSSMQLAPVPEWEAVHGGGHGGDSDSSHRSVLDSARDYGPVRDRDWLQD